MLKIAPNLKLPDEAVTQTFAILAKRGVGKTYTASVMVEEMLKNKLPVVVLDPIGVWWGLRSSADGKKAGLSIIIAGGDHADIPLTPENGEIMANLIIDDKLPVVLDLSHFRKNESIKFVTDFAETLYRHNRTALHLVIDEADAFAPQRPFGNEARMLGAIEDIVRRGRARGIGVTMITQRPAVLNKNVLTQIEVLVAMRMTAPLDQKAIDEWVKTHAEEGQREQLMAALPSMPIGTAWFWSPGWLDIFKKVEVRKRETLDSSSTPKVGKIQVEAQSMAEVDIDKIRQQLAATIEKVESEDPKVLKKQVEGLRRQLLQERPKPQVEIREIPVLSDEDRQTLEFIAVEISNAIPALTKIVDKIRGVNILPTAMPATLEEANDPESPGYSASVRPDLPATGDEEISNYAKSLLATMAQRHPMKLTRAQIATLSGRRPRSSSFSASMTEIQRNGLAIKTGDQFEITEDGLAAVGSNGRNANTPEEIRQMWLDLLPAYERDLLAALMQHYPSSVSRERLAEITGRSITSSSFGGALSSLAKNGLIDNSNGSVRASDTLFV